MSNLLGVVKDGKVIYATEQGLSCLSVETGECICAECYHYGIDNVNCANANLSEKDGLVPIKWDNDKSRFVVIE